MPSPTLLERFGPQVARKGTGFLTANDVQAMVSDEEDEEDRCPF